MLILGKRKHCVKTLLVILVIFNSKSTCEGLEVKDASADNPSAAPNANQEENSDGNNGKFSKSANDAKSSADYQEETNTIASDEKEDNENPNQEENNQAQKVEDSGSSQTNEKHAEDEQPSAPQEEMNDEGEKEDSQKLAAEQKKHNVKLKCNNRKTSLKDVDAIVKDKSRPYQVKRETRTMEFLGLPRDASYFFDDLEPFINNNSAKDNTQESGRAVRSIPAREGKALKAKLTGKKDTLDEEAKDEEEDDNEKEDEEKASEGDYEEDEDQEPDCQILTTEADSCTTPSECSSTTKECTTKRQCTTKCTTKSTCSPRKTTTKCTTKFTCSTPCPTTEESTKCPKICAKGNDKRIHYPLNEKAKSWDEGKRLKSKVHGKIKHENAIKRRLIEK